MSSCQAVDLARRLPVPGSAASGLRVPCLEEFVELVACVHSSRGRDLGCEREYLAWWQCMRRAGHRMS